MADSSAALDYYTVLKVHPSADQEIIEAAYRQLMKKHHPDKAGRDADLAALFHQSAKVINQAHSVLRDPVQRRQYDMMRGYSGPVAAPPRPSEAERGFANNNTEPPPRVPTPSREPVDWEQAEESMVGVALRSPFAALAAVYYLLPGPYEWEGGRRQELLATCLLPPVGIAAFALATGRLAPWVGHSLIQTILAWGILLVFTLPSWSSLPRMIMAGLPSLLLMTGTVDGLLRQASVPAWLAWSLVGFLSLVLSARLYLFAVLPTLGACWLLTHLG